LELQKYANNFQNLFQCKPAKMRYSINQDVQYGLEAFCSKQALWHLSSELLLVVFVAELTKTLAVRPHRLDE